MVPDKQMKTMTNFHLAHNVTLSTAPLDDSPDFSLCTASEILAEFQSLISSFYDQNAPNVSFQRPISRKY